MQQEHLRRFIMRTGVIGACFAVASSAFGGPQGTVPPPRRGEVLPVVSSEDYDRALGVVFSPTTRPPKDLVFSIVVRFCPSFAPESQVVIRQGRGEVANVEYISADQNLYTKLNEMLRERPGVRPEVLAREVRVQRRVFNLPVARSLALQDGLFASLNETMATLRAAGRTAHRSGETTVALDGEAYEVWYEQGLTRFSGFFSASEADLLATPNAVSIGKWARALREEMAHLLR